VEIFVSSTVLIFFFPKKRSRESLGFENITDSCFENSFIWLIKKEKAKYEIFIVVSLKSVLRKKIPILETITKRRKKFFTGHKSG